MSSFPADDGTLLAYHRTGAGEPVIALPGGPMQSSAYLAGLPVPGELIRLDLRGSGESAVPDDAGTYRCDRQVPDVEALRRHLGHNRIDLLGHSAGASLAVTYAARHPDRIRRLVLLNPSPFAVGVTVTDDDRREVAETRRGEPWFGPAYAGFERIWAGTATEADWAAIEPFRHGHRTADIPVDQNEAAAAEYYAGGAVDPAATRAALARLAGRSCWSAAPWTSPCRRGARLSTRRCSRGPSWPCSPAAGTTRGPTTGTGWGRR